MEECQNKCDASFIQTLIGGNNMSEEKLNELKEKVAGLQEELKELTL